MRRASWRARILMMAMGCILAQVAFGGEIRAVNAKSGVTLRQGPSRTAGAITTIPLDAQVVVQEYGDQVETIEEREAPWAKVAFEGKEGWVFSGFLSEEIDPVRETALCRFTGIEVGDYQHFGVTMPDGTAKSFWMQHDIEGTSITEENQKQYVDKRFQVTWIKTRWYIPESGGMMDVEVVVAVHPADAR